MQFMSPNQKSQTLSDLATNPSNHTMNFANFSVSPAKRICSEVRIDDFSQSESCRQSRIDQNLSPRQSENLLLLQKAFSYEYKFFIQNKKIVQKQQFNIKELKTKIKTKIYQIQLQKKTIDRKNKALKTLKINIKKKHLNKSIKLKEQIDAIKYQYKMLTKINQPYRTANFFKQKQKEMQINNLMRNIMLSTGINAAQGNINSQYSYPGSATASIYNPYMVRSYQQLNNPQNMVPISPIYREQNMQAYPSKSSNQMLKSAHKINPLNNSSNGLKKIRQQTSIRKSWEVDGEQSDVLSMLSPQSNANRKSKPSSKNSQEINLNSNRSHLQQSSICIDLNTIKCDSLPRDNTQKSNYFNSPPSNKKTNYPNHSGSFATGQKNIQNFDHYMSGKYRKITQQQISIQSSQVRTPKLPSITLLDSNRFLKISTQCEEQIVYNQEGHCLSTPIRQNLQVSNICIQFDQSHEKFNDKSNIDINLNDNQQQYDIMEISLEPQSKISRQSNSPTKKDQLNRNNNYFDKKNNSDSWSNLQKSKLMASNMSMPYIQEDDEDFCDIALHPVSKISRQYTKSRQSNQINDSDLLEQPNVDQQNFGRMNSDLRSSTKSKIIKKGLSSSILKSNLNKDQKKISQVKEEDQQDHSPSPSFGLKNKKITK